MTVLRDLRVQDGSLAGWNRPRYLWRWHLEIPCFQMISGDSPDNLFDMFCIFLFLYVQPSRVLDWGVGEATCTFWAPTGDHGPRDEAWTRRDEMRCRLGRHLLRPNELGPTTFRVCLLLLILLFILFLPFLFMM